MGVSRISAVVLGAFSAVVATAGSGVAQEDAPSDEAALLALVASALPAPTPAQTVLAQLTQAERADDPRMSLAALDAALAAYDSLDGTQPPELPVRPVIEERRAAALIAAAETAPAQSLRTAARETALDSIRRAQSGWDAIYGAPNDEGAPAPLAAAYERLATLAEQAGDAAFAARLRAAVARTLSLAVQSAGPGARYSNVTVFYATSRQVAQPNAFGRHSVEDFKGRPKPETAADDDLSYGRLSVSVPHDLEAGEVRGPSLSRFEFRPDPRRHVIISDIAAINGADRFFADVRTFLDGDGDPRQASTLREAVVFVHGYNNSFGAAARRAAKLAFDLQVDGVPFLYSWASEGDLRSYVVDRIRCDNLAVRRLAGFLNRVVTNTGAERIHIVAHSMGNCLVVKALDALAQGTYGDADTWSADVAAAAPPLDQVVLAAPDVTRREFDRAAAARIRPLARGMTVYASDEDWALRAARALSGEVRVGQVRPPLQRDRVDVVDATDAPTDVLGHTHFAQGALDDLRALLWAGAGVGQRCLLDPASEPRRYRDNRCDVFALRLAADGIRQWGAQRALDAYCPALALRATPGTTTRSVCEQVQVLSGLRWQGR